MPLLGPALPGRHCSYGLMRQTLALLSPLDVILWLKVFAGCCQPLLRESPSRCSSADLFLRAWTYTPAASRVHSLVIFPQSIGLPHYLTGSAHRVIPTATSVGVTLEAVVIPSRSGPQGCSPHRWLLPSHLSMLGSRDFYIRAHHGWLPAPCSGYANRPNPSNWR